MFNPDCLPIHPFQISMSAPLNHVPMMENAVILWMDTNVDAKWDTQEPTAL